MRMTTEPVLRRCWHAVAFAADVDGGPIARRLLATDIVLWRSPAGVHAAHDRCPHRWARLSQGEGRPDGTLVCPYHGWEYGADGKATRIPQLGVGATLPPTACLTMLPVDERYGLVWASLDPSPIGVLPEIPEFDDDGYRAIPIGTFHPQCSAAAVIDNNTDVTHVAFVHAGTFGAGQDPAIPPLDARRTWFGIEVHNETPVAIRPGDEGPSVRTSVTEIWLPFVQVSRMRFPDGRVHVLVKGCCPVDDDRTAVHLTVLRNDADDHPPGDEAGIVAFESAIEHEDATLLASLPVDFPLDVTAQVHLRHDRGGIEWRRALAALVAGELPVPPVTP